MINIQPVEADGQFWVCLNLDGHEMRRHGPFPDADEAEVVAARGMWDAAVDMAVPMWWPKSVTDQLKCGEPESTGDARRDYELKDDYEGGQMVTTTVVTALSMLPIAETAEAAQLAAQKLLKPSCGLGIVAQEFTSVEEIWAQGAKDVSPIRAQPVKEVHMNRQNATTTGGEIASKKRPDVTIVGDQPTYAFVEVPSGKDVRTVRDFARLITKNHKDLRQLGNKSEGLYIIWKD